jgi:hypothetical protein
VDQSASNETLLASAVATHTLAVEQLRKVDEMAGKKLACAVTWHILLAAARYNPTVRHCNSQTLCPATAFNILADVGTSASTV